MIILSAVLLAGCASNNGPTTRPSTRPSDSYGRQEAAMQDPFGYAPDMGNTDVSGGSTSEYDHEGMKRDIDTVLNP